MHHPYLTDKPIISTLIDSFALVFKHSLRLFVAFYNLISTS